MYNQAWQQAQKAAQRPYTPYSYDPSAFVAPLNPLQMQAMGNIAGYQGAADPYYQMAGGMAGLSGMTTTPEVVGQYMSPYMSQVIDPTRAAIEQQQAGQRSQQQAEQIKAGAFGQERGQLMRAVLEGQQNLGLGQALAPLYQTGYGQALQGAQADLNRQLQAAQIMGGLGSGYQQAGLAGAGALLGAGTLGQQTQQAGLQALYNQYMQQQQYPFMTSQYLTQTAAGLGPGYGGTTYGTQTSQQPLSYFGNPLSDPDLKTGPRGDDKPEVIGETNDGQKIYRYRLIDPDTGELGPPQIGLMADEVEEKTPEAVGNYKGYRTVDYAKATDDAARMGGGVTGRGDYADGGGIEDILKSQEEMYKPLSDISSKGIVPTGQITPAKLDTPSLSYAQPQKQQQGSLAQGLEGALSLYKGGKETLGLGKEAASALGDLSTSGNLGGMLGLNILPSSYTGAAAAAPAAEAASSGLGAALSGAGEGLAGLGSAAASGLAGLGETIMSVLPEALLLLSDPKLKTGVRPGYLDGGDVSDDGSDFDKAVERTFKFEGGYNPDDAGKGPSMYGINQSAHPGVDVGNLTRDKAREIYKRDYWDAIDADKLPSNIREMAYDTAVISGPGRAREFLEKSGGDPEKFMSHRENFLQDLIARDPGKYGQYAKSWASRNAALRGESDGIVPLALAAKESVDRGEGLGAISRATSGVKPSADEEARGISGFLRGTKPEGLGEKAADFLTSERFIVPLLAGLGTMASSGSRFLAPAILQGVGGGAKAYAELAQQQFDREKAAQQLGLQERETKVKEAGIPLTERELRIKEQEAARKMRALQELAKTAGKPYEPTAPSPAVPATPVGEGAPVGRAETPAPGPVGGVGTPVSPTPDFWSDVDPMMNPTKLLGMAQEAEQKASVAAQDFPEWSKMLNDQALKFRSAAQDILKGGSVLKGGKMVPIPGALETEKQKAQQEAETKADMELVDVQPKAGGPTYKVTRKQAREMAAPEVAPGAGSPPGGSVPQGAILSKQPAWTEKRMEDMRSAEVGMLDQFKQRQVAKERMDALIDSLRVLETGKFAERKAETIAALRAIGIDVPDTATANPAEFQKFIKNSTANVFDQVKAMGGKILVSEITGLTKANANPELQPGANAALLGQAKGLLDYEDKHFQDYADWRKSNPDAYDATDFERQWVKENPLSRYVKEAEMGVGARGAPLLPVEKREKGYTYTNDQGVTGRWNGKSWDVIGGPRQ